MTSGLLWWLRVPWTSRPWQARLGEPASLVPPLDALTDPLPAGILFGLGLTLLVAPLTTTLMGSVPVRNAGLASAVNNALSRVGQPLVAAATFIAVSGTFAAALAAGGPGVDPLPELPAALRAALQPLNPPPPGASPAIIDAVRAASTAAFHQAAAVCAAMVAAGAAVNAIGLRGTASTSTSPGA